MRRPPTATLAAALAGSLLASPVVAQTWRAEANAADETTAALAVWPSGHALVARCQAGDFQVFLRLPQSVSDETAHRLVFEGQSRDMSISLPLGQDAGQILFTQEPSRAARWLTGGGQLTVEVTGQPTAELLLPDDPAPLRAAMQACNRAEVDARDLLPMAGSISWRVRPMPEWPQDASPGTVRAIVGLSCVAADGGRLTECVAERESPAGQGFGRAAIRSAQRARLDPETGDGLTVGMLVRFNIAFSLHR